MRRMNLHASRFETLGDAFYTRLRPTPLPDAYWVGQSHALAAELGLPPQWFDDPRHLQGLAGNLPLPGSSPLASVYSGHQFGHWAGQLGDGRAITLGDHPSPSGPQEVQLKGAGLTPYSRMGDGRAVLRSSIREFLCSEAMHTLGVPTTRALCVVGSSATVRRERWEPAAVVTRVAPSFIRFGHFEHFAHRGQHEALRQLADFVITHFYPECQHQPQPYATLLQKITERTADLLALWQVHGFCHGVMNTDNMSVLGLTIDYGPFQFLDAFDPAHICNHSDTQGRYAFGRQPQVAHWNLYCLGQAMLPLLDDNPDLAYQALASFPERFASRWQSHMNRKLGLETQHPDDTPLIQALHNLLAQHRVDHTHFWRQFSLAAQTQAFAPLAELFAYSPAWHTWLTQWQRRLEREPAPQGAGQRMLRANPRVVLRNHLAELAIQAADQGDMSYLQRLHNALATPYDDVAHTDDLSALPPAWAAHIEISCSS